MRSKIKITLFFLFFTIVLCAQEKSADKIIKRNGEIIVCKVSEVGDDEIKYLLDDFRSDVAFGIDKNKVASIVFGNGRELKFSDSMYGKENYNEQSKNAFKFNFFSPLTGATSFAYERSLQPGRSIETGLGIIGLGQEPDGYKASGIYLNLGYKFIKDPDFYIKGMRYAHVLKGAYFKPELAFSSYRYTNKTLLGSNILGEPDQRVTMAGFILNVGKQWVFADRFLVDWYVGAGYGFGKNDPDNGVHFAFVGATSGTSLVLNSGFRIGLLF